LVRGLSLYANQKNIREVIADLLGGVLKTNAIK